MSSPAPSWAVEILDRLHSLSTAEEVAAALRLPEATVRTYVRLGKLQRVRFGGPGSRFMILKESVAKLLQGGFMADGASR